MKNLFLFEIRKLLKSKTFLVFTIIFALQPILSELLNYFIYLAELNFIKTELVNDPIGLSDAVEELKFMSERLGFDVLLTNLSSVNYTLCISIFVGIFICSDFSEGTVRNVLSRGYNRLDIFVTKYTVCMLASTFFVLLSGVLSFTTASIAWGTGKFTAKILFILAVQFLSALGLTSFFVFIAYWLKKISGAIVGGLFIPLGIDLALSVATVLINVLSKNLEGVNLTCGWLEKAFIDLSYVKVPTSDVITYLVIACSYIVVFTTVSAFRFSKSEH